VIHVNGELVEYEGNMTIASLLVHLGFAKQICAVEVNNSLVPHTERENFNVHEGDKIEIVSLVGGG
jgi:thiamine biosynthesis protein ThiS